MEEWTRHRSTELASLVDAAMPAEGLTDDELLACCWDDPGVVLATPSGDGAASAVVRSWGDRRVGFIRLLAVHPGARRAGVGRALLAAAESWLFDEGAVEVHWGASAPFYLWPGVDVAATAALCLAESAGYLVDGAELNLSCPTTFRAAPPSDVEIRRALDDADGHRMTELVAIQWPHWVPELERGIEQGGALGAFRADGRALGFACHSVNRSGWVGPMGTDPAAQGDGVGSALLGALCQDLMIAGHADAEIAWVGPVGFYARVAGAATSRVFRRFVRARP
jgi:GNAT superfamily N-acetyltransferase